MLLSSSDKYGKASREENIFCSFYLMSSTLKEIEEASHSFRFLKKVLSYMPVFVHADDPEKSRKSRESRQKKYFSSFFFLFMTSVLGFKMLVCQTSNYLLLSNDHNDFWIWTSHELYKILNYMKGHAIWIHKGNSSK